MLYNLHTNLIVNQTISSHLEIIKRCVLKILPNTLSILLVGSFGRGEGIVKREGNRFVPINDYDLICIF